VGANLKAALIGLGVMGKNHARVLSSLPGVDLVGVYDPAGDPTGAVKKEMLLDKISDLIPKNIDYCVIAVPTVLHEQVALEIIDMGANVFIEKPLAHSVDSAQRISYALANAHLVGAVGQIERYNPALVEAKKRIESDQLGKIYQIYTRRQGWHPVRIADVGVVKDLGTHDIDLTSWISQKKYTTVTAHTAYYSGKEHEDIVSIIGQLEQGIVATHMIDWLSPFKIRETTILGEKGALVADTLNAQLTYYPNSLYDADTFRGVMEGDVVRYSIPKKEPLLAEHEAFRDYVLGISDNVTSIQSGIETLKVAEAVLVSAKVKKSVDLLA
jgi:UDP-N-acetylglucosamine 3-dehydrogenase